MTIYVRVTLETYNKLYKPRKHGVVFTDFENNKYTDVKFSEREFCKFLKKNDADFDMCWQSSISMLNRLLKMKSIPERIIELFIDKMHEHDVLIDKNNRFCVPDTKYILEREDGRNILNTLHRYGYVNLSSTFLSIIWISKDDSLLDIAIDTNKYIEESKHEITRHSNISSTEAITRCIIQNNVKLVKLCFTTCKKILNPHQFLMLAGLFNNMEVVDMILKEFGPIPDRIWYRLGNMNKTLFRSINLESIDRLIQLHSDSLVPIETEPNINLLLNTVAKYGDLELIVYLINIFRYHAERTRSSVVRKFVNTYLKN